MVVSTAHAHGVFLGVTQAGQGLAGIQDTHAGPGDGVDEVTTTSPTQVTELHDGDIETWLFVSRKLLLIKTNTNFTTIFPQ